MTKEKEHFFPVLRPHSAKAAADQRPDQGLRLPNPGELPTVHPQLGREHGHRCLRKVGSANTPNFSIVHILASIRSSFVLTDEVEN